MDGYCIGMCSKTGDDEDTVGCDCTKEPATTTIPSVVFQSPAIGLITVGVISLFKVVLACFVISRHQKQGLIICYIILLLIMILLQMVFGEFSPQSTTQTPSSRTTLKTRSPPLTPPARAHWWQGAQQPSCATHTRASARLRP
jgi:hypothetical protein